VGRSHQDIQPGTSSSGHLAIDVEKSALGVCNRVLEYVAIRCIAHAARWFRFIQGEREMEVPGHGKVCNDRDGHYSSTSSSSYDSLISR
jgi:hypothetical protein